MRVTADLEQCIGSGECVLACSSVFGQDDDGTVVILQPEPPTALHAQVHEAIGGCPAAVLSVEE